MPLTPGSRLGPYEIIALLGVGGMGEVYRARDTKLGREVAIKVLSDTVSLDSDRLARFEREARTLASLNHPNIAQLYGIESQALVMELVEGEDLSELIGAAKATPYVPLPNALAIARQIIDALEAAHDIGIVHRDLKPANIKVREDGTVKVLDFGLAKAMTADVDPGASSPSNSPTLTARATQMGMILGTAAYMSPEQARGRAVDKRTDVWAFGCVLYEMLTGKKAFDGEDATEIISAVVKTEPDFDAMPATVPAHVRTVVTRCLVKDRKARIPDISVVRYMLEGTIPTAIPTPATSQTSVRIWQAATALFVIATLVTGAAWYRARSVEPVAAQFEIAPPDGTVFTVGSVGGATAPVISPDGRTVAFTAQGASARRLLYVRPIDSATAQPLAGTEGAAFPFWSPDSRFIGYSVTGKLLKIAVSGGLPQVLCPLGPGLSRGGSWSTKGVIVFNNGPATPLHRVAESGGAKAEPIGILEEGQTGRQFPSFLPDGRHFLFHASGSTEKSGVWVGSLDSNEATRILSADSGGIYDKSGHLLFVRQGILLAQSFNPETFALAGDPYSIAEKVESFALPGIAAFSVSDNGVLAYGVGQSAGTATRLTWVDRQGKFLGTVGPPASYRGVSLSPDGLQVAAHRHEGDGGDIWVTDLKRNATTRFTFDATQDNASPAWSPKGDRIAFESIRDGKPGIEIRSTNGTGDARRVFETTTSRMAVPTSWSPDGKTLLFGTAEAQTGPDLWTVPADGTHPAAPRIQTRSGELSGQISPDSRWLAYQSTETGTSEVYVQSMIGTPGKTVISNGGGNAPRWRRDSRELYFLGGRKLWAAEIAAKGDLLVPGVPKALFDYRGIQNATHVSYFTSYDTLDGQTFLVSLPETGGDADRLAAPLMVVLNWRKGIR